MSDSSSEGGSRAGGSGARSGLDDALERLVGRAVLTAEQADAVRAEAAATGEAPAPAAPAVPAAPAKGAPPVAEAAGYAGAILAVVAAIALASRFWTDLEPWAQLAILGLTAVALWAAGAWARRGATEPARLDPAADRLAGFLWLWSTIATGGGAWVLADGVLGVDEGPGLFLLGLLTAVQGGALWWARRGALQLLGWYGGVLLAVLGLLTLAPRPPVEWYGLAVWALGVAWLLLAWGEVVAPRRTGLALGGAAAAVGAQAFVFGYQDAGLVFGLATAGALLAVGAGLREAVLTAVGTIALAIFLPQALGHWFPGSFAAPLAVLVTGLAVVAGAIATARAARGDA